MSQKCFDVANSLSTEGAFSIKNTLIIKCIIMGLFVGAQSTVNPSTFHIAINTHKHGNYFVCRADFSKIDHLERSIKLNCLDQSSE